MQAGKGLALEVAHGKGSGLCQSAPTGSGAPSVLLKEFKSVTNLGMQEIEVEGRVMKRVQLFECRSLR